MKPYLSSTLVQGVLSFSRCTMTITMWSQSWHPIQILCNKRALHVREVIKMSLGPCGFYYTTASGLEQTSRSVNKGMDFGCVAYLLWDDRNLMRNKRSHYFFLMWLDWYEICLIKWANRYDCILSIENNDQSKEGKKNLCNFTCCILKLAERPCKLIFQVYLLIWFLYWKETAGQRHHLMMIYVSK